MARKHIFIIGGLVLLAIISMAWGYYLGWLRFGEDKDLDNNIEDEPIFITSPQIGETVASPITITGRARGAWYFEGSFPISVIDQQGKEIGVGFVTAQGEWMTTEFVPFVGTVNFTAPLGGGSGKVILKKDNPSDLREFDDQREIPVIFSAPQTIDVKVFFGNSQLDPGAQDCTKVFAIPRTVARTEAVARAALQELFEGPTVAEQQSGYFTSINSGVTINSLTIENGAARADFNEQLEFQVGGSCRVAAIRAQIRETLKQFASVGEVIISVNGRAEDILQP